MHGPMNVNNSGVLAPICVIMSKTYLNETRLMWIVQNVCICHFSVLCRYRGYSAST